MPIDMTKRQICFTNQEATMMSGFSFDHDDCTFIEEQIGETQGLEIVPFHWKWIWTAMKGPKAVNPMKIGR